MDLMLSMHGEQQPTVLCLKFGANLADILECICHTVLLRILYMVRGLDYSWFVFSAHDHLTFPIPLDESGLCLF